MTHLFKIRKLITLIGFVLLHHACHKNMTQLPTSKHAHTPQNQSSQAIDSIPSHSATNHEAIQVTKNCPSPLSSLDLQQLTQILTGREIHTLYPKGSLSLSHHQSTHLATKDSSQTDSSRTLKHMHAFHSQSHNSWSIIQSIYLMMPHATYAWRHWYTPSFTQDFMTPFLSSSSPPSANICYKNFYPLKTTHTTDQFSHFIEFWIQQPHITHKRWMLSHQISHPTTAQHTILILLHPNLFKYTKIQALRGAPSIQAYSLTSTQQTHMQTIMHNILAKPVYPASSHKSRFQSSTFLQTTDNIWNEKWGRGDITQLPALLDHMQAHYLAISDSSPLAHYWYKSSARFQWSFDIKQKTTGNNDDR